MLICPVRHHSPASARQVQRLIEARRPRLVLVEGPSDASSLIPWLLDPESIPPLALYSFLRRDDAVRAAFYPFCAYSPEYVALQVGERVGAELRFCDLPAGAVLVELPVHSAGAETPANLESNHEENSDEPTYGAFAAALTHAAGFGRFEEFWEAAFEQDAVYRDDDAERTLLADFGARARSFDTGAHSADARRERQMAAVARAAVESGVPDEAIVLVCGAAHADAVARAFADPRLGAPEPSPEGAAAEVALVPYSFPRLSEQAGYGAGNHAPWFYQQVWERGLDFSAATRGALAALAATLRARGHSASLAQTIDAYVLARRLAHLRGKLAPGVDELTDSAVACFGQGRPSLVQAALHGLLIGETVGRITPRVGRTPLQQEFYAEAQRLRLPILDAPRQLLVHPGDPREAEQSAVLHRLGVARIPYARELESGLGGGGRTAQAGALQQLGRVREKWELCWSPAVDAALIERSAWGSTLGEVCARLLGEQIARAERVDEASEVVLRLALCDLSEGDRFVAALARCQTLAADSLSSPALARATYHLDGLLGYGSARPLPRERLLALGRQLSLRAVLQLPAGSRCGDEAAEEMRQAIGNLAELARRAAPIAADAAPRFWEALDSLAEAAETHPMLRGVALVLLELEGRLAPGSLSGRLRYWLSRADQPLANAHLVAGLFSLHRGTLVRNAALIGAVTDFLLELEVERLIPLLPTLRRGLGNLSPAERGYLSETLGALLGLDAAEARRALTVSSADQALLREADRAVAATLGDWEQRYGIVQPHA